MARWSETKYNKIWKPELNKLEKLDEDGNVEFYYVLMDDIPEEYQVGLPQFIGHDGVVEVDDEIGFKYERMEDWLRYLEITKDKKWLTKGRGKKSEIPLTKNELKIIRQGQ